MTRLLLLSFSLILTFNSFSQQASLSDYSFVIVPEQYEFLSGKDKYQLNSMTKFYLEKGGFNVFMDSAAPNVDRCEGLYAEVEELRSILGTKLQIVLRDCNDTEIYRGAEGKSKYKEFDKSYQDALRKALKSVETLGVNQKDVVFLKTTADASVSDEEKAHSPKPVAEQTQVSNSATNKLPDSKFLNYSNNGKTFLLRKTAEGYSLYEESAASADGLLLKGKIIVMNKVVKYMDSTGKVFEATFDSSENLTIGEGASAKVYESVN